MLAVRKCFVPKAFLCNSLAVSLTWITFTTSALYGQLPSTRVMSVFPPGGQQGHSVDVTITGSDLEGVDQLHFTHPGITAIQKTQMVDGKDTPQPIANQFTVTIAKEVPVGVYDLHASGNYGVSNPRAFTISDHREITENDANNVSDQAQEITLNTIINGRSNGGSDMDYYKIKLASGERLIVDCWAQRIDSRMDAILVLFNSQGQEIAYSDNFNHRDPLLDFIAPQEDDYLIAVHDQLYNGNAEYFYRLRVTSSYIDYAFPPVLKTGVKQSVTLFGRGLPGGYSAEGVTIDGQPLEKVTIEVQAPEDTSRLQKRDIFSYVQPEDALVDGFDYRLQTDAGSTNPVLMTYSDSQIILEKESNDQPDSAQSVSVPCDYVGQFQHHGDHDWITFDVKQGQRYWIQVFSQRLGGPADPHILIQRVAVDESGNEDVREMSVQDDDGTNIGGLNFSTISDDPAPYLFTADKDGSCRIRLRELAGNIRGNPRFVYRLSIREPNPDFRAIAVPIFPIPQEQNNPNPWTFHLRKGGTAKLEVYAFRKHGFNGEIQISVEGLPDSVSTSGAVIGPNLSNAPLVLQATEDAENWVGDIRIVAKAIMGDQEVVRDVRAGTVVWSVAQGQPALSRLSRATYLSVGGPAPFIVQPERGPHIELHQSHELYIPVKITRHDKEFKGEINVTASRLPGNVQNQNIKFGGDQETSVVHLFVNNNAPIGTYTFYLQASTQVPFTKNADGKDKKNIAVIEPSVPLFLTIKPGPLTIEASVPNKGQVKREAKLQFSVKVNRKNDFTGKVSLELMLPPGISGVSAETAVVPEDKNQIDFIINVAADATVGNHAFVNLRAQVEFKEQSVNIDQTIPLHIQ